MAERGRGGIILTGSFAGTAGSPMVATYAGTKAFSGYLPRAVWEWDGVVSMFIAHRGRRHKHPPAMARLGIISPEDQGVDPEIVARHALEHITEGPVFVMPEIMDGFQQLAIADRRTATELSASVIMATTEGIPGSQS